MGNRNLELVIIVFVAEKREVSSHVSSTGTPHFILMGCLFLLKIASIFQQRDHWSFLPSVSLHTMTTGRLLSDDNLASAIESKSCLHLTKECATSVWKAWLVWFVWKFALYLSRNFVSVLFWGYLEWSLVYLVFGVRCWGCSVLHGRYQFHVDYVYLY